MDTTKINQALQQLDEKAEALQKQGKYGESLDILEEILNLKKKTYGEDSDQYFKTSEKLCELCNLIAMICLQKEKFEASLDFLKKAETLALNSLNYKAITFNNLACYYRRTNKLRTALQYLEKALKIEITLQSPQTLADTHLNLCAVLSQLNRHQEALEHVLLSVVYLQDEVNELQIEKLEKQQQQQGDQSQQQQENQQNEEEEEGDKGKKQLDDRISVLAIAYHNMGVELEYLKRFEEAIQTYTKAVKFAEKNLGKEHQLVDNLNNVRDSAIQQIQQQKNKENKKKKGNFGNSSRVNRVQGLYADINGRPKTNQHLQQQNQYYQNNTTNQFYNNNNGNNNNQQLRKQSSNQSYKQQQQQQQEQDQQYQDQDQQQQQQQLIEDQEYDQQQQQSQDDDIKQQ